MRKEGRRSVNQHPPREGDGTRERERKVETDRDRDRDKNKNRDKDRDKDRERDTDRDTSYPCNEATDPQRSPPLPHETDPLGCKH